MSASDPVEVCEACRFDGEQYDVSDALGTLRAVPEMWREMLDGVADGVLAVRPAPEVWSATEYVAHSADITEVLGRVLHAVLAVDDLVLDERPPQGEPDAGSGMPAAVGRLGANLARFGKLAASVGDDDAPGWRRTVQLGEDRVDAAWILRHAIHDATHHLSDVGRGLHLLGAGAPTQEGVVAQLNVSTGGVPKLPTEVVEVGGRGVVGDRQADRRNHGRPLQAICLWSTEVIDALRAEGHPIHPGLAGENLTVSGVDWTTIRSGVQLLAGEVLLEVSASATPCAKNAAWFTDGDFRRMDHDRHPGWSRMYAWVREPGTIRTGDRVIVEP